MTKPMPKIPLPPVEKSKGHPVALFLSTVIAVAGLSAFIGLTVWVATWIAGRTDLFTLRECFGIGFAVLMIQAMSTAFIRRKE
jgi:hypothetical protein